MKDAENTLWGRQRKLLVVDDAISIRNLLTRLLEPHGFIIESAENGREALALMEETAFDLVITDIAMPVMDGLVLTRTIMGTRPVDIIVITGKIDQYSYDQVVSLGASDYIEKPFSAEELLLRVKRVLRERQLKAEAVQLQQEKEQASRFEAIGQLAAGIAHEINTPIQYIGDNVQFIGDSFQDLLSLLETVTKLVQEEKMTAFGQAFDRAAEAADLAFICREIPVAVEQTQEGVGRIKQIIRAMKNFSHPGKKEHTMADLNRCIQSTVIISKNEWKYIADLDLDLDEGLPEVRCNPGELNQVFLNLIVNACHAIEEKMGNGAGEKGKILIRTQSSPDSIEIQIEDSGTGIPEQVVDRIFDPFFTTKEIGKGTGQGLSIAKSIVVQRHNGTIDVETLAGEGTRFVIRLPLDTGDDEGRQAVSG